MKFSHAVHVCERIDKSFCLTAQNCFLFLPQKKTVKLVVSLRSSGSSDVKCVLMLGPTCRIVSYS